MELRISETDSEQLKLELMKGIEDIKNGRVHNFNDFKKVFDCIMEGDKYLSLNDYENAERMYRESTVICKDKSLSSYGYYKLGLLNYKFQKPEILYSKLYFELALEYGNKDASYYLATIYEWEKETKNFEYDSERINYLYKLATEEATSEKVKKLVIERMKNTNK